MKNNGFRERLVELRKSSGLKSEKISSDLNITFRSYQRWESGNVPLKKNVDLLAHYFGCSSSWLMTGKGFPGESPKPEPSGTRGYASEMYKKYGPIDLSPDAETLLPEIEKRAKLQVSQDKKDYDLHGGWEPSVGDEEWAAPMGKAYHILTSATIYKGALLSNINAFFVAIQQEELNKKQGSEIDNLKKECDELKLRLSEMEKNLKGVHVILEQKIIDLKMQTDRRTGGDRRKTDEPVSPEDDRRSGEDRRKAAAS